MCLNYSDIKPTFDFNFVTVDFSRKKYYTKLDGYIINIIYN